eukprot:gnl/Chilomastix_caulleri/2234.p1 GENE.gnl/Chilomastix_caulleri/2234~~gnl/Chilomastix_caulleri/2234.p1  ORF type:complete len:94 (+),score=17.60 gnl/Chilomastix_caulleri/2234:29-310(+)
MEHRAKAGEEVKICLPFSAGTGYMWLYAKPIELDFVSDETKSCCQPGMCGGKNCREVIVRPIMKGTFTLHCILARLNDIGHPAETQDHVIIVE